MDVPFPTPGLPRIAAWIGIAALAYLAWCLFLWLVQGRLLYLPHLAGPGLPEAAIAAEPGLERLAIAQDDGVETEAWLLRSEARPARGLVAFFHGNAELIDRNLAEARAWTRRGFDALLPEYRGYGRVPGTPTQARLVADAVAAIDAALVRTGGDAVLLHGRSLGTGVAVQVAPRLGPRLAGLVLESPFTSIAGFAWRFGVPPLFVRDPYRSDAILPTLEVPILILHARDDEIVPIAEGRRLAATSPRARLVELEGSHNSGLSSLPAYWDAIDRWHSAEPADGAAEPDER